MNDVESQYVGNKPLFLHETFTTGTTNSTDIPMNTTEYTVTEDPMTTTIAAITSAFMSNDTVLAEVLMNNGTVADVVTVAPSKINDLFYIYVWAAAILGCIIFTTGRLVYFEYFEKVFDSILSSTLNYKTMG